MKKVAYSLVLAAGLASTSVMAADMAVKAPPAAAPPPSPWDVVVTAALMTDYNFRGISQSNHKPSTQAGFELRYNWNSNWQSYGGISGESINFPNNAAAEIDFYGGIRPTFDKLALDFGAWYYYYPGGQCFNTPALCTGLGGGTAVSSRSIGARHRARLRSAATSPSRTPASGKSTARAPTPLTINGRSTFRNGTRRQSSTPALGALIRSATSPTPLRALGFRTGIGMYASGRPRLLGSRHQRLVLCRASGLPGWREVHQLHQLGRGHGHHLQGAHA